MESQMWLGCCYCRHAAAAAVSVAVTVAVEGPLNQHDVADGDGLGEVRLHGDWRPDRPHGAGGHGEDGAQRDLAQSRTRQFSFHSPISLVDLLICSS